MMIFDTSRRQSQKFLGSRTYWPTASRLPTTSKSNHRVNWPGIVSVLKKDYAKDPTAAVKAIERLLNKFDALDDRRKELNSQIERCTEKKDAKKIKSLQAKLAKQERAREDIIDQEKRLRELVLRAKKKAEKVGG